MDATRVKRLANRLRTYMLRKSVDLPFVDSWNGCYDLRDWGIEHGLDEETFAKVLDHPKMEDYWVQVKRAIQCYDLDDAEVQVRLRRNRRCLGPLGDIAHSAFLRCLKEGVEEMKRSVSTSVSAHDD